MLVSRIVSRRNKKIAEGLPVEEDIGRQVGLACQFIKVTDVDVSVSTFEVTLLLYLKWIAPELKAAVEASVPDDKGEYQNLNVDWTTEFDPKVKFVNAIEHEMEYEKTWVHHISERGDPVVWKYQRYKGRFYHNMNLRKFPFDSQDLMVVIDTHLTTSECVLVKRDDVPMSFSGKEFQLPEWEFMKPMSQSDVKQSPTPSAGVYLRFSKFILNIPVRRRSGYYFYNVFGTALMLCFLQAIGFCLPTTAIEGRLGVMLTLVLTQLAFKFAIMDRLPRVHYLSTMDKYMMFTMFCSMVVAAEHVFVIQPFLDPDAAAQIDFFTPVVLLIIMILVSAYVGMLYCKSGSLKNPTEFKDEDLVFTWDRSQEFQ